MNELTESYPSEQNQQQRCSLYYECVEHLDSASYTLEPRSCPPGQTFSYLLKPTPACYVPATSKPTRMHSLYHQQQNRVLFENRPAVDFCNYKEN